MAGDNVMQLMLARLSAENADDGGGGGGGGGGATTTASAGNIFDFAEMAFEGLGKEGFSGVGNSLNFDTILAKDFKSLLDEGSGILNWIFGKINIGAGPLFPTITYYASIFKTQQGNLFASWNLSIYSKGGGGDH